VADSALQRLRSDVVRVLERRGVAGQADQAAEEMPDRAASPAHIGDGCRQFGIAELMLMLDALREDGDFGEVHDVLLTVLGVAEVLSRTVGKPLNRRYWGIH
jgi:hypothetical protein